MHHKFILYRVSHSLPNPAFFNKRLAGWLADRCSVSQQLGALQTHTTDTFLFISNTANVLLFKFRFIKEMPGSVASGTHCIRNQRDATLAVLFIGHYKNTLHVSDVHRVHHQEYINCRSSHWCMSWVGMMYIH